MEAVEKALASALRPFLDTQYGIRRDGEHLMIVDSPVSIDPGAYLTMKGPVFRGTEGLCVLLTRKNVNTQLIGK